MWALPHILAVHHIPNRAERRPSSVAILVQIARVISTVFHFYLADGLHSESSRSRRVPRPLASDDVDAVVHWQVLQCVLRIWLRFASLCSRLVHATTSLAFAKYQHDLNSFRSCRCRGPLAGASMRSSRLAPFRPPLPSPQSQHPFACICKIST